MSGNHPTRKYLRRTGTGPPIASHRSGLCDSVAAFLVSFSPDRPDGKMEDDVSVDLWTKIALTIIAASLAVIAWKLPFTDIGHAQIGTCGSSSSAPCHIATDGDGLKVQITNPQDFH
jgi:hypothetical protein